MRVKGGDIHDCCFGCDAVELHALCAVLIIIRLSLGGENEAVVVLAEIRIKACAVFELHSALTYLAVCEQTVCGEVRLGVITAEQVLFDSVLFPESIPDGTAPC